MARRLNFGGGLAGLADVTKQLLLSQAKIYENKELRRIRAEQKEIDRKLKEAQLARNFAAMERYAYLKRKAANDELVAAGKAQKEEAAAGLKSAAVRRFAPGYGLEVPEEGDVSALYEKYGAPPKPKSAAELEKDAQAALKFDLYLSNARLKTLEDRLQLTSNPKYRLMRLNDLATSQNQKEQQLYLQYQEELKERGDLLSNPNVLNKYRQRALEASGRPAYEIMEEVEQGAAAAAQPDTSKPPEELMERLMQGLEDFDEE